MKKILVLLSMFALASGVWAADYLPYGYSWTVEILNVPYKSKRALPEDLVMYLVNKADFDISNPYVIPSKALVATSLEELDSQYYQDHGHYQLTGKSDYEVLPQAETVGLGSDYYFGRVTIDWRTDLNLAGDYNLGSGGVVNDLIGVIYGTNPKSGEMMYLPLQIKTDANSHIGTTADYMHVVPEPTSGLLLILGVAGLALRRKKAA